MQQREEVPKRSVPLGPSRLENSFAYHLARQTWLPSVVVQTKVGLPPTEEAPGLARQAVHKAIGSRLDEEESELIEVLVSELVSNAIAHAGLSAQDRVVLHLALVPERVRVEVCDGGAGFTRAELGKPRSRPGGYGLTMVDRGASRWGISSNDGACVWFEIDRGAPAD
jgi:anti-sigma regulatory factor (Ser/Thr protein kinase)